MPGGSQPMLFKQSTPPSTQAVAPIEPVVIAPPQPAAPRRQPTPPPAEPIWRQRRLGSQTVQGVAQTSMSSAWMSLEEAIGRWVAAFARRKLGGTNGPPCHTVMSTCCAKVEQTAARSSRLSCCHSCVVRNSRAEQTSANASRSGNETCFSAGEVQIQLLIMAPS